MSVRCRKWIYISLRTITTEEVVQCKAQDVHGRCDGFSPPMPLAEYATRFGVVFEVRKGIEQGPQDHNIIQGDGHPAARQRVPHVPRVTQEDDTRSGRGLPLLNGREE